MKSMDEAVLYMKIHIIATHRQGRGDLDEGVDRFKGKAWIRRRVICMFI